MENKIPGKRSRNVELFGLELGRLKTNINDLQAYENHIGNRHQLFYLNMNTELNWQKLQEK